MDRRQQQTNIHTNNTRSSVSVHRDVSRSGFKQSNDNSKKHDYSKRHRHYKYLYAVILSVTFPALVNQRVLAETVGGVSATASPVANSSGSVTNKPIKFPKVQNIPNTMVVEIQGQEQTLIITPFPTPAGPMQNPYKNSEERREVLE